MERIIIIGSGGAGKSTLAKQMGKLLDLEVVHLDAHYWQPGWVKTPNVEWEAKLQELISRDSWVMDGNFRSTLKMRVQRSDTIIFLDFHPLLCTYRAVKRTIKYKRRSRPDMAEGCPERFELEFLRWIYTFRKVYYKGIMEILNDASNEGKTVYILKNKKQVEGFISSLEASLKTSLIKN